MVPHCSNPQDCSCIYAHTLFNVGLALHELVHDIRVSSLHDLNSFDTVALGRAFDGLVAEVGIACQNATWNKAWDFVESTNRSVGARILNFIRHILRKLHASR